MKKIKTLISILFVILISSSFLKSQSNSQTQLQIGFHYKINNDYPIFYRNAHPTVKDYKKTHKNIVPCLQIFVQYDTTKLETDTIQLNKKTLYFTIERRKYTINTRENGIIISNNHDSIIRVDDNHLKVIVYVNDWPSYDKSIRFEGINSDLRIIIKKDLQIKTIAANSGFFSRIKKQRNSIDFPVTVTPGEMVVEILKETSDNETAAPKQPSLSGKWPANILPDSSGKGILYLNFKRIKQKRLNDIKGKKAVINSDDTLGQFYITIPIKQTVNDYTYFIKRGYTAWDVGALTIPFKWVLANSAAKYGNLLTNVNAGIYIGKEFGSTKFYINSSNNHNPISFIIAGFANTTALSFSLSNAFALPQGATSATVLGLSYGGAFQVGFKNLFFAISLGADVPISAYNFKWEYNNKLWVGFGISYNLGIFGNSGGGSGTSSGSSSTSSSSSSSMGHGHH